MKKELPKTYNPKDVESNLYDFWLENKYFHAHVNKDKKPYVISMPPPNITGHLHMGHALDQTLQDILIRFKRMQGFEALWVPGVDHAAIATEAKIVEAMKKDGVTKESIGREEFLKRAWAWKEKFGNRINEQIKKLGSSCDWSRERFTLDEGCSKAVKDVFVRLYDKGYIYKGERLVNWCPVCKTSISDAEVDFTEHDGHFWHLKYPLSDGSGELLLATTRPETLLGDTAVAVHPDDVRYQKFIGKTVTLPLVGRKIPIVADKYVEQDFGTGVVKITPAHDPNDFEVGKRHKLPFINVMDENAVMNENAGKYQGMDRYEARKKILEDLKAEGFLVKVEDIKHNVGSCYRCNTIIEPRLSEQWFVKMKELALPALDAVKKTHELKIIPERFEKIYINWLENIKDWCISRQLWWGHRIPVWYCDDCNEVIVSKDDIHCCPKCSSNNIYRDENTLDTWFSSALWPFSVLGWPEQTEDFRYFYPNDTLVTGYDIIFFWVIRMVFSGLEHTGKLPFKKVLLHGMVRDDQGRKMSKSLGNGIDPLKIIDKYGADALRFTLVNGNSPGNDMRFSDAKVEASRNFANKIWNASRFIMMNLSEPVNEVSLPNELETEDKWIISSLNDLCKEVTDNIEKFEFGVAVQKLYDFIWDQFCDWYIEFSKARLNLDDEQSKSVKKVLVYVMANVLKLLHPFMPFITEEIYKTLVPSAKSIMIEEYPRYSENLVYMNAVSQMQSVMEAIKGIRNRRSEMNVPMSKKSKIFIATENEKVFTNGAKFIKKLAYASDVIINKPCEDNSAVTVVTSDATIYIPLSELIDKDAELARLNKELTSTQKQLDQCNNKLSNETFLQKAPKQVVDGVKLNQSKLQEKVNMLCSSIENLSK